MLNEKSGHPRYRFGHEGAMPNDDERKSQDQEFQKLRQKKNQERLPR
jgi:hypothetical protein